MKIAVLLGGTSAERDVSLSSGIAVCRALRENGHEVTAIDCAYGVKEIDFTTIDPGKLVKVAPSEIERDRAMLNRNLLKTVDFLLQTGTEVVFNALHGGYGENGQVQAVLDIAGIPYTGSGMVASALGMDKNLSKILFQTHFVPTAPWKCYRRGETINRHHIDALGLPLVVKPNSQGSTVGLTIVSAPGDLARAVETAYQYDDRVLIEQYVPGREITVAVLGDTALPIVEIKPESGFYDYESKYQSGKTQYEVPAQIPAALTRDIQQAALRGFRALQCRGYARLDFRLRSDDQFFCLELNTLPGMTATSLVPKAAKAVGIGFNELVERIVEFACAEPLSRPG